MPEDENGQLPFDPDDDNPDEWRDASDDPSFDPHEENDDG